MAIEKLKKLTILFPAGESARLEAWLYRRSAIHLTREEIADDSLKARLRPLRAGDHNAAGSLAVVREVQGEFERLKGKKANFIDSMLPVKTVASSDEMERTVKENDFEAIRDHLRVRREKFHEKESDLRDLKSERAALATFASLRSPLRKLKNLRRTFLVFAEGTEERLRRLEDDGEAGKIFSWELVGKGGRSATIAAGGDRTDISSCLDILKASGFRILDYPSADGVAAERIREIEKEEMTGAEEAGALREELLEQLPDRLERALRLARGYWESGQKREENAQKILSARRIGILRGYVRADEAEKIADEMEAQFPGVGIAVADPETTETVPVSLTSSRLFRPGRLLVSMFGLPNYFSLDPTPYLMFVFLAFFGICFADVVYGLLLAWIGWKLMKRYEGQESLREFFRLFLYCGVSSVVFGVVTGSWAADIYNPDYLGADNILLRFVRKTTLLDMLAKPLIALIAALALGVMNQFYGILMRVITNVRQKNWAGALYDGVFWLVYLAGLLLFALSSLIGFGGSFLPRLSLAAVGLSAVGLILTQGRDQPTRGGKLAFGLISLYGIVGGYGTTSFIGDVLSYSRLLALGLNTYIVGMSFNIIARIIPQILMSVMPFLKSILSQPVVSGIIIAAVMVAGHLFNFFMSIMSAFVHSARLILLEFFGRFYQGDAKEFQPHGFWSETVELRR
jgi:V/A-type H+-transporting ATPase subunit I